MSVFRRIEETVDVPDVILAVLNCSGQVVGICPATNEGDAWNATRRELWIVAPCENEKITETFDFIRKLRTQAAAPGAVGE